MVSLSYMCFLFIIVITLYNKYGKENLIHNPLHSKSLTCMCYYYYFLSVLVVLSRDSSSLTPVAPLNHFSFFLFLAEALLSPSAHISLSLCFWKLDAISYFRSEWDCLLYRGDHSCSTLDKERIWHAVGSGRCHH